MAIIGDSATSNFFISMAEVRIGPLTEALALTSEHSIGLLDSATVSFAAESVDLKAGLPKRIYDTQITDQSGTVSMDMREYSKRNMQILLGHSPTPYTSRVEASLLSDALMTGNTIILQSSEGAQFAEEDLVLICPKATVSQADLTYAEVTNVSQDTLTLGPRTTPLLFDYVAGDKVILQEPIPIGANTTTQYFTAQVLGVNRAGIPIGFILWKCALSSGLEVSMNADDFNTNTGELKILTPSAADISVGGDLYEVRDMVAKYPQGMTTFPGDI